MVAGGVGLLLKTGILSEILLPTCSDNIYSEAMPRALRPNTGQCHIAQARNKNEEDSKVFSPKLA